MADVTKLRNVAETNGARSGVSHSHCHLLDYRSRRWCGWSGSNRHSFRNRILSPARLPISPHPRGGRISGHGSSDTAPVRPDALHEAAPPEPGSPDGKICSLRPAEKGLGEGRCEQKKSICLVPWVGNGRQRDMMLRPHRGRGKGLQRIAARGGLHSRPPSARFWRQARGSCRDPGNLSIPWLLPPNNTRPRLESSSPRH